MLKTNSVLHVLCNHIWKQKCLYLIWATTLKGGVKSSPLYPPPAFVTLPHLSLQKWKFWDRSSNPAFFLAFVDLAIEVETCLLDCRFWEAAKRRNPPAPHSDIGKVLAEGVSDAVTKSDKHFVRSILSPFSVERVRDCSANQHILYIVSQVIRGITLL